MGYTNSKDMTKLSEDLKWRGLIKDKTFSDNSWLDDPKAFYLGIDASSDSMTVGNLAVILLAKRFIDAGWKAVMLAGGATSLVGDPGGKEEERNLKPKEEIQNNVAAVKAQIETILGDSPHETVNNLDWMGEMKYLDFLRDVGKNYSMTELLQRDFVSARIGEGGSGISYAEFSYSLLQGYDFWWLFKNKGVVLQIGASDQWGNMLSGVPLVRKKEGQEVHAMSMPLVVNKVTGKKFGKSEDGAVWLDPAKTSSTQFYQFWVNSSDEDVEEYLKIYTFLSREEIDSLMKEHITDLSKRKAQKVLAEEVTKIVHGTQETGSASGVTKYLTGQASIANASDKEVDEVRQQIKSAPAHPGTKLVQLLVASGLASSNTEARRLVEAGAIYINGEKAAKQTIEIDDFKNGRLLIRRGKAFKDSALIELE